MRGATDLWTLAVIAALAAITVLTRCFFFILDRPWSLPPWAERALQYAPVAALAGTVAGMVQLPPPVIERHTPPSPAVKNTFPTLDSSVTRSTLPPAPPILPLPPLPVMSS